MVSQACSAKTLRLAYDYCRHLYQFCSREQFEASPVYCLRDVAVA